MSQDEGAKKSGGKRKTKAQLAEARANRILESIDSDLQGVGEERRNRIIAKVRRACR